MTRIDGPGVVRLVIDGAVWMLNADAEVDIERAAGAKPMTLPAPRPPRPHVNRGNNGHHSDPRADLIGNRITRPANSLTEGQVGQSIEFSVGAMTVHGVLDSVSRAPAGMTKLTVDGTHFLLDEDKVVTMVVSRALPRPRR